MILAKKEETLKKWIEVIQLAQSVSFHIFFLLMPFQSSILRKCFIYFFLQFQSKLLTGI